MCKKKWNAKKILISNLIKEKLISQSKFAESIGMKKQYFNDVINNRVKYLGEQTIKRISKGLRKKPVELFEFKEV